MTSSLSTIHSPPKRTRIRRRSGSAKSSRWGRGPGTRKWPMDPAASGPCCQDSPIRAVSFFHGRASAQWFAAVDVDGLPGDKGARHGEEDGVGDVVDGTDAAHRVAGADLGEVLGL